jgi:hypothetical protein
MLHSTAPIMPVHRAEREGSDLGTSESWSIRQAPHEHRCKNRFVAVDRATGEVRSLPCKSLNCAVCSRRAANRARSEISRSILAALRIDLCVHRIVITAPAPMLLSEFQHRRGRLLEDAKRSGLIAGSISVLHAHGSGYARGHIYIFGSRTLRRSDWTPLLRRHHLGLRDGFNLTRISRKQHAHREARYATDQIVGLKARLERISGPIRRLNAVIIPSNLRRLVGVSRRKKTREPGRWIVFRAPHLLLHTPGIYSLSAGPRGRESGIEPRIV